MEGRGEIPSLPSNYVSILHLRERWLKEKERNQKEKEEEKQPEQQVQQLEVQRREPVEKNDQDQKPEDVEPTVQNPPFHAASRSENGTGKFQRHYRVVPASNRRNVNKTRKKNEAEGEPLLDVPRTEEDKKKKKSKRKARKKNLRAHNEEMDKTSGTPGEKLKEEIRETECKLGVQKKETNVRARRVDEKKGIGSQCGPETGKMHEMKEMEHKLSRISVDFETTRGRNNGVYRGCSQGNRNFRDHQNLRRWGPRRQRDDGMIWVRKDELSKGA